MFPLTGCDSNHTTSIGQVMTPHYPNIYPSNAECTYIISQVNFFTTVFSGGAVQKYYILQDNGTFIVLNFLNFDLEYSSSCSFDYLEIRDGDSEESPLLGKFCGDESRVPEFFHSSDNQLWMR